MGQLDNFLTPFQSSHSTFLLFFFPPSRSLSHFLFSSSSVSSIFPLLPLCSLILTHPCVLLSSIIPNICVGDGWWPHGYGTTPICGSISIEHLMLLINYSSKADRLIVRFEVDRCNSQGHTAGSIFSTHTHSLTCAHTHTVRTTQTTPCSSLCLPDQ